MCRITRGFFVPALCFALVACAKTKHVDVEEGAGSPPAASEEDVVSPYPDTVAGKTRDLYGEDVEEAIQSESFQEAVEDNPLLGYNVVYFEFNSSAVNASALELLARHADYLAEHPEVSVLLEGHADKRGSSGYNLALGDRRAQAVKDELAKNGVVADRLSVVSYGEEQPAVDGDTEEAFSKNRRVEIIYR